MFSFAKTGPAKPNSCNIILRAVLKIWWWCMQNDVTTAWHSLTSFRKKQFLYNLVPYISASYQLKLNCNFYGQHAFRSTIIVYYFQDIRRAPCSP